MAGHTETLTVKLWDHIERNPGLTVDELVDAARRGNMIPPSLNREYAAALNKDMRRRSPAGRSAGERRYEPWTVDRSKAERYMVVRQLGKMRSCGSIRRDEDGRHFTVRPIKRQGIGAMVQQPEDVRADMLLRQLRIQTGLYLRKHPDGRSYMPKALYSLLRKWYEASQHEYLEQQRSQEGA